MQEEAINKAEQDRRMNEAELMRQQQIALMKAQREAQEKRIQEQQQQPPPGKHMITKISGGLERTLIWVILKKCGKKGNFFHNTVFKVFKSMCNLFFSVLKWFRFTVIIYFFTNHSSSSHARGSSTAPHAARGASPTPRVSNDASARSCAHEHPRTRHYSPAACQSAPTSTHAASPSNAHSEWYPASSGNGYTTDTTRQHGGSRNDDARGWSARLVFIH